MEAYLDLLRQVLDRGKPRMDRTGVGTISLPFQILELDLVDGFPLVTTKRVHFKSIVAELLWFLSGDTHVQTLQAQGVHIWDAWADEHGWLGPIYSRQWRSWTAGAGTRERVDQLGNVIKEIQRNPTSRRLVVSAWNVAELPLMRLPPCHYAFQFYVDGDRLSTMVHMRSADLFLGLPFNIASYALLTHLVGAVTNLMPGELVFSLGDAHIYLNHLNQVHTQLARTPYPLPTLNLRQHALASIDDFTASDIELVGYHFHPSLPAPVAV